MKQMAVTGARWTDEQGEKILSKQFQMKIIAPPLLRSTYLIRRKITNITFFPSFQSSIAN